jgi:F0F1-type ATP synthase assembly protein I
MQSVLLAQTMLIFMSAGFSYYYMSDFDALSAVYGGGIALFSSVILMRRATQVIKLAGQGSRQAMYLLYFGVMQRYAFVLLGLGLGLIVLKLSAKPLLIVFGIAQLAYFVPVLKDE